MVIGKTSGFITGAAITSLNKFLLYGLITNESLRADVAINRIAVCIAHCRFEETHRMDDEGVLMKLLELCEYCIRCEVGRLITEENVWKMIQLCYTISYQPRSSVYLSRTAENTLAHVILTVFDHMDELVTLIEEQDNVKRSRGYGISLLERILQFLSSLLALPSPSLSTTLQKDESTCVVGLRLINIVLETAGTALGAHPSLVSVLQGDLSKYLLQNSETDELAVLSLTLRVVFNLFNSIKDHLKVQLEVFFTSVHMRILDSPSCSDEQKELALESLLEFCREPAMMLDLYINYDCDVHCTNLFEVLCKSLVKHCQMMEKGDGTSLNALTLLCLEGLLAVLESIARRCPLRTTEGDSMRSSSTDLARPMNELSMDVMSTPLSSVRDLMQMVMSGSDTDSEYDGSSDIQVPPRPTDQQLAWLHTARERTAEVLQQRKRTKKRYALVAEKFNTDQKNWISYAQEMELLPTPILTPESVAYFLLHTPGLNKTLIGDYLGNGPPEKYPFNQLVRDAYLAMIDFTAVPSLDEALRLFLAKFRLPGEAQKIDRMMEAFSKEFFKQSKDATLLFADADVAYVLAFSIIMLNTDLHSDQIAKKMTLEEFIRNNRGINDGKDLPIEYLTEVYENIKDREIQMQHDVSDVIGLSGIDHYSLQWEGVLKRSENVVGASFTSNASILKLRAGLYEKDMFLLISESALKCMLLSYEKTCDVTNMERILEGLANCAKIALYFDMIDLFNKIMSSLSTYFLTFAHGILNGEKVYLPPRSSDMATMLRRTSQRRISVEEEEEDNRENDTGSPENRGDPQSIDTPIEPSESMLIEEDHIKGARTRRALLALKLLFQFVHKRQESFRHKAWASVIECILMFNELDVVPTSLVEMDDFVDSRGVPLPPIQGGNQSPTAGTNGLRDATGVSGKTRERSRRVAERQAAIRSRMKSMSSGSHTSYGNNPNQSIPPTSGSIWDSLTSYLWAEEQNVDQSFSLVSTMLREAVSKLGGNILEKENWLRMVRKLPEKSLAALLETLVTSRDPFKGMMRPSGGGVDAMMQENAILVLELCVDLILVNVHRIVSLNLWLPFHNYAAKILSTPLSELEHMQCLAERVVVHILRVSIRLFHDESVRPLLMTTLELLEHMDDDMSRVLCDRVAIGINMLLKANLVYMHEFHDWPILMGILEKVVQYKNGRAACWESVRLLAEGGHLKEENVTLWMAICLRFVSHRTPYSVDALRLLQLLTTADSIYNLGGGSTSWLEVMRVMLSYLNDDRPPIAKTAWECLYNSLLQPGVSITKDTWRVCFSDVIFAFDDQVNEGVWKHSREASLYSVTLLSKTFLHNLTTLAELSDFEELWLSILRRLANKLVVAGHLAASSSHAAVVFETTLQSLYNLLLIMQAEAILNRPSTKTEESKTILDTTLAVVNEVIPHLKDQLGLMPPPPPEIPQLPVIEDREVQMNPIPVNDQTENTAVLNQHTASDEQVLGPFSVESDVPLPPSSNNSALLEEIIEAV